MRELITASRPGNYNGGRVADLRAASVTAASVAAVTVAKRNNNT